MHPWILNDDPDCTYNPETRQILRKLVKTADLAEAVGPEIPRSSTCAFAGWGVFLPLSF